MFIYTVLKRINSFKKKKNFRLVVLILLMLILKEVTQLSTLSVILILILLHLVLHSLLPKPKEQT